jgi:hypothetical protein
MAGAAPKKVVVVGGVAGGASAAARLRRLSEEVDITIFERGPHVSFANCGLPYFVGDVIQVGLRPDPQCRNPRSRSAYTGGGPCLARRQALRRAPPQEEAKLLVANAAKFNNWFNIQVGAGPAEVEGGEQPLQLARADGTASLVPWSPLTPPFSTVPTSPAHSTTHTTHR